MLFRQRTTGVLSVSRSAGTVACLALVPPAGSVTALVLAALVLTVLLVVVLTEHIGSAGSPEVAEVTPLPLP